MVLLAWGGSVPRASSLEESSLDADIAPDFSAAPREDDVALVIGIEKYRDLKQNVEYASADAELVVKYLLALGFQPQNIRKLTNERASRMDISVAVEKWLPNNVKPTSKVFVYYSGHGSPDPVKGDAYLLPYDGDPGYISDYGYSLKTLYDSLGKLPVSEVVVIIDACFSGAGERSQIASGQRPLANIFLPQDRGHLPPNMAIMAASASNQTSVSSPDKKHGIFTYHFLKAIKDGQQTLGDIYKTIKPQVAADALRLNVTQSPTLTPAPEKLAGRFLFSHFESVKPKEVNNSKENEKIAAEMKLREEEQQRKLEKIEQKEKELKAKEEASEKALRLKAQKLEEENSRKEEANEKALKEKAQKLEEESSRKARQDQENLAQERRRLADKEKDLERRKPAFKNIPPPP